jgi:hypothetical protein
MYTHGLQVLAFLSQSRCHHHHRATREMTTAAQVLNHFLAGLARQTVIQNHKVEHGIGLQELDGFVSVACPHHIRGKPGCGERVQEEGDIAVVIVAYEYRTSHVSMSPVEV